VSTSGRAQAGRDRAREARLRAAHERRRQLDPDQIARDQRIAESVVDVELAWERRATAEQAVADAEALAAEAIQRLLDERLTQTEVIKLTGLDQAIVRRLRQSQASVSGGDVV
jgi:pyruvate/2-oxoglutarate dehydrogenase complex dihydrolipoamide acyltransferase (E2) component